MCVEVSYPSAVNVNPAQKKNPMSDSKKQLAGAVVALGATITEAMDAVPGFVPCGTPAQVIVDAIRTYADGDDAAAAGTAQDVLGFVQHVNEHRGVTAHQLTDVDALSAEQSQLAQKVIDIATSAEAPSRDPARTEWMYRALGALEAGSAKAADLLAQA